MKKYWTVEEAALHLGQFSAGCGARFKRRSARPAISPRMKIAGRNFILMRGWMNGSAATAKLDAA